MLIIEFYDEVYLFGSINSQLSNIVDDHNLLMIYVVDSHLGWSWSIFLNHVIWSVVGMSCTSHHPSCILKLCRDLMVRPYRYIFSIVCCPRRGTMRLHILRGMKAEDICIAFICIHWSDICIWCGFIPSEVWRQSTYTLCSYAYIEVIFAGIVDAEKCYTNYCGCLRKWDGIGYIETTEFYIYKNFWS